MTVLARPGWAAPGLTGTGDLTRLAVRRDRIGLAAGIYVIVAAVTGTAYAFKKLYPTEAGRAALAATGGSNPALRFLYGRLDGSSLGSLTTWRYGIWAGIFAALLAIFVVIRHTRADEEAGRLELVGSTAVGRNAALAVGVLLAAAANGVVVLLIFAGLAIVGLPAHDRGADQLQPARLLVGPGVPDHDEDRQQRGEDAGPDPVPPGGERPEGGAEQPAVQEAQGGVALTGRRQRGPAGRGRVQLLERVGRAGHRGDDHVDGGDQPDPVTADGEPGQFAGPGQAGTRPPRVGDDGHPSAPETTSRSVE